MAASDLGGEEVDSPQQWPLHFSEGTMDSAKSPFRIDLTPERKAKVRDATGKDAEAVELSVEELEERIAPRKKGFVQ
jgi:hypothetical protein